MPAQIRAGGLSAGMTFDTPPTVPLWKTAMKRTTGTVVPRIEARARSLNGPLGAYRAVCGVPSGPALPIGYPDLLCRGLQLAVLTDFQFPFALMGIVHVAQRIEQARAIAVGEPLSGRVWVDGHRPARRGVEFDLWSEVSAGAGDGGSSVIWLGTTTILSTAIPGDGIKREFPIPSFTPTRATAWTLPEHLGRAYAAVSGDANPIHQYAWAAKLFGFKRAIMHGWWTLARALAELDLPDGPGTVDARFLNPLLLPSTAWFSAGASGYDRTFTVGDGRRVGLIGTAR